MDKKPQKKHKQCTQNSGRLLEMWQLSEYTDMEAQVHYKLFEDTDGLAFCSDFEKIFHPKSTYVNLFRVVDCK